MSHASREAGIGKVRLRGVFLEYRLTFHVLGAFLTSLKGVRGTYYYSRTLAVEASDSSSSLAKFNTFTGSWQIFLVMFVIMELLVAIIYIVAGFITPTYSDNEDGYKCVYS